MITGLLRPPLLAIRALGLGLLLGAILSASVLGQSDSGPSFATQPATQTVALGGSATMNVAVSGSPAPTLQWQVSRDAGASWTGLANGGPYSGASSDTLTITGAPLSLSGSLYRCAATNRVSTAVGSPAFLMLTRASVATLAGSATAGSVDGSGSAASFFHPGGVAVDAAGNVYVADTFNHRIRVVNPAGLVTTLAGAGVQGSTDDTGTAAGFSYPRSVALDASGNVYVADAGNHAIRRVSPAGVVTTFAGSGSSGSADGAGTAASFNCPSGIAADAAGNLYVADSCNQRIRHISPAGVVTTLAGSGSVGAADGTGTAASLAFPRGVAVDSAGIVYVADTSNFKIRRVSPDGVVTTLAGSGSYGPGDGSGSAAGFHLPETVATDPSGNVYVADASDCMIRAITPAGVALTSAGHLAPGATDGAGAAAGFFNPGGVAVNAAGAIYVADANNNRIRKITQPPPSASVITWVAPSAIDSGTAVSAAQLNATADVPGTFGYAPAAGTVPDAGTRTLSATFTPVDTISFAPVTTTRSLTVNPPANQVFLQRLFQSVLGRPADPGGLAAFLAAMGAGRTRAQVLGDLYSSLEYSARQVEPAIRLYYAALARPPDNPGLQNWSNALHLGTLTLTQAADQFAGSPEFQLRYGALDNPGYVQQLYRNVLGREADPTGLADWVGQLNGGASRGTILVGFSESDEFKARTADAVEVLRLFFLLDQRMPTEAELRDGTGFLRGWGQTDTLLAQGHPDGIPDAEAVLAAFRGFLRRDADAGALGTFGGALGAGTLTHGGLVETVMNSA